MKNNSFNNIDLFDEEKFKEQWREKLSSHRKNKLGLSQEKFAELLNISHATYQRWESANKLPSIFDILNLFRILEFTTYEIINLLQLPLLKEEDIINFLQDKDALKEGTICHYLKENSFKMSNSTIEALLDIISEERLKRRYSNKNKN